LDDRLQFVSSNTPISAARLSQSSDNFFFRMSSSPDIHFDAAMSSSPDNVRDAHVVNARHARCVCRDAETVDATYACLDI